MIDLGIVHGEHLFYTGGRSLAQLIEDGEIVAVPTPKGIAFKRREICSEIEIRSAYTLSEVRAFAEKYGSRDE